MTSQTVALDYMDAPFPVNLSCMCGQFETHMVKVDWIVNNDNYYIERQLQRTLHLIYIAVVYGHK